MSDGVRILREVNQGKGKVTSVEMAGKLWAKPVMHPMKINTL